ncbi:uncharacterized protein LOC128987127 isoform X1 [Macrosteles quadrilineatus]|uniref:uncharacterized protein LOC128987127 isoform X1 n=1 Tax=Macrosteles quadrilineatus TaxID=74068 RepID=UPI0023E1BB18|nr:uncharacterized protein LOC128987127 isoform X1 [Macrosteles quadrilineatus]
MSRNFYANQLEREFRPTRLGNWEVPSWLPQRPRARKTTTKIIVNDRGHLLPGVQRPPQNPWGSFRGTWQLPNKISRKFASELTRPSGALSSWEKRSAHVPIIESSKLPPSRPKKSSNKDQSEHQLRPQDSLRRLSPLPVNDRQPYDKHHELDYSRSLARERSPEVINTSQNVQDDINEYTKNVHSPVNKDQHHDHNGSRRDSSPHDSGVEVDELDCRGPPLASVYCSAEHAKNLKLENQKHQPLPDTIEDSLYRSLQLKQTKHPGMGLNVQPRAAAVGVKGYGAPAPTQCSKLKVYRPKTAGNIHRRESRDEQVRPKTSQPKRKEHMSEIELALCWDFKPVHPSDEPKRSPHIDGSNGSAAPAVFALVHQPPTPHEDMRTPRPSTGDGKMEKRHSVDSLKSISRESADRARSRPKTAWGDEVKAKQLQDKLKRLQERSNPSAVMDIINNNTKENNNPNIVLGTRKTSSGSDHMRRKSLSGQQSLKSSDIDSHKMSKQKHYQSSPNLANIGVQTNGDGKSKNRLLNNRPCMACDAKTSPSESVKDEKRSKSEYKMAFKAGKPNNGSGNSSMNNSQDLSSTSSRAQSSKPVHVPKMKLPYAKKSYSIGTLAPPFSLWPGTTGQDYPEHWRLASVYQHSFKPVELRRKPLLQSVYQ